MKIRKDDDNDNIHEVDDFDRSAVYGGQQPRRQDYDSDDVKDVTDDDEVQVSSPLYFINCRDQDSACP